jgi:hypothetical protein
MPQALAMAIQQAIGTPECCMESAQAHSCFVAHVHR